MQKLKKNPSLINNPVKFSGAGVGKIHLNKQVFPIDELISEVIDETTFITSFHNITAVHATVLWIALNGIRFSG